MNLDSYRKDKPLNRDIIKYIAVFTMFLNHYAHIFLAPDTLIFKLFNIIGYFTAPTMCYFLAEGYHFTHSKQKYAVRLFLFALISQIPFSLALYGEITFYKLNMIFTLFLCFLILLILNQNKIRNMIFKAAVISGIILLSQYCDWGILAPIYTLLFFWAEKSDKKIKIAYVSGILISALYLLVIFINNFTFKIYLFYLIKYETGLILSGFCIIYLYNGRRMKFGKTFSKWFFYLFYPAHLMILRIISVVWYK